MAAIEFDNVSKVYGGDVRAVADLNLKIEDAEFVVLLGPSGCGKSTALRMVAGLEQVTSGDIRIDDKSVTRVPPRDRDVAMVFQNYALYPHMNVYDNVGFGLRMRGVSAHDRKPRIERAAGVLGLAEHLKRKPSQLSGGQRQRVAMGRAIVREPKAFLMDEPLSNLDARLRVQMRTEIVRIQRELGVTTIYVTHDQVEAMTMADRVAVMRGGYLQQYDTPDAVYARPANLFVGSFIGSPAMNLLAGRLERRDGELSFRSGAQSIALPPQILQHRPEMSKRLDSRVAVGFRPEALRVASEDNLFTFTGMATMSESLGFETLLYVTAAFEPVEHEQVAESSPDLESSELGRTSGGEPSRSAVVIARLPAGSAMRDGEGVRLSLAPELLHFFDLATGEAIR
jgi:multiple sugar transport system ATP-binding protein